MTLPVTISHVIPSAAEQEVIVEADSTRFGVFDGYKPSADGIDRFACSQWMESLQATAVLSAIIPEDIEIDPAGDRGIVPNTEDPEGFQHHTFRGQVIDSEPDIESMYGSTFLYGGTDDGEPGTKRTPTESNGCYLRISVGLGDMFVQIPEDWSVEISDGDVVEVQEIRTDLVGFTTLSGSV